MSDNDHFTVVFAGDLRKLSKNPFKIASEFGEPVSVALGNALDELDEYRDEAIPRLPHGLRRCPVDDKACDCMRPCSVPPSHREGT